MLRVADTYTRIMDRLDAEDFGPLGKQQFVNAG
jgi:hypothetical protein